MSRHQAFMTRMYSLSNRYLLTREYLDASVMRLKGGFTPYGELANAQRHVDEIANLFEEMKKTIRQKDEADSSTKLNPERRTCCS